MAVVRHVLRAAATGSPLLDRAVPVELVGGGFVPAEHAEVVRKSYPRTSSGEAGQLPAGTVSIDLTPNSQVTPAGTHYTATVPGEVLAFVVPDGSPPNVDEDTHFWWLEDLLVNDPPTPGPVFYGVPDDGDVDDVLTRTGTGPGDFEFRPSAAGGGAVSTVAGVAPVSGDISAALLKTALNLSGSNSGDETAATIKTKLGVTVLSGANTGDQDLSSLATVTALTAEATARTNADTALTTALAGKADLVDGTVPRAQLPNITSVFTVNVADEASMLAVSQPDPDTSIQAIRADVPGSAFWLNPGLDPSVLGNWLVDASDPTGAADAARAFAVQRANHTGTQLLATISDAGTAASADTSDFDAAGSADVERDRALAAEAALPSTPPLPTGAAFTVEFTDTDYVSVPGLFWSGWWVKFFAYTGSTAAAVAVPGYPVWTFKSTNSGVTPDVDFPGRTWPSGLPLPAGVAGGAPSGTVTASSQIIFAITSEDGSPFDMAPLLFCLAPAGGTLQDIESGDDPFTLPPTPAFVVSDFFADVQVVVGRDDALVLAPTLKALPTTDPTSTASGSGQADSPSSFADSGGSVANPGPGAAQVSNAHADSFGVASGPNSHADSAGQTFGDGSRASTSGAAYGAGTEASRHGTAMADESRADFYGLAVAYGSVAVGGSAVAQRQGEEAVGGGQAAGQYTRQPALGAGTSPGLDSVFSYDGAETDSLTLVLGTALYVKFTAVGTASDGSVAAVIEGALGAENTTGTPTITTTDPFTPTTTILGAPDGWSVTPSVSATGLVLTAHNEDEKIVQWVGYVETVEVRTNAYVTPTPPVFPPPPAPVEIAGQWQIPEFAAMPTRSTFAYPFVGGQTIQWLTRAGRKMYLGGGDMNANSGPVPIISMDLDNPGTFTTEHTATTEYTGKLRILDTDLFAVPFGDPQAGIGNPENGSYAVTLDGGATWVQRQTAVGFPTTGASYSQHVGDIAKTVDGWWLCGLNQVGDPGECSYTVWRSEDDGVTWTDSLTIDAGPNNSGPASIWFLQFLQFGDDLWVTAPGADPGEMWKWTSGGSDWTDEGPSAVGLRLSAVIQSFQFDDAIGLYCLSASPFGYTFTGGSYSIGWNGNDGSDPNVPSSNPAVNTLAGGPFSGNSYVYAADVSDDGHHLYVLASTTGAYHGDVWKISSDGTAVHLFRLDDDVQPAVACICVDEDGGFMYYGDVNSTVYQVALP